MNYYAKATTLIADSNLKEKERLLFAIMADKPETIIAAYEKLHNKDLQWKKRATELIKQNLFISAIKYCRETTGMSLREAREACKKIRNALNKETVKESA